LRYASAFVAAFVRGDPWTEASRLDATLRRLDGLRGLYLRVGCVRHGVGEGTLSVRYRLRGGYLRLRCLALSVGDGLRLILDVLLSVGQLIRRVLDVALPLTPAFFAASRPSEAVA
jgi:hypothetical protein